MTKLLHIKKHTVNTVNLLRGTFPISKPVSPLTSKQYDMKRIVIL